MDPLTHAAVGLFLSRAGLNRWTPRATPILILAAEIPDIDVVTMALGSVSYLHYHRNLTHSPIAMPLMALLPVVLVRVVGRQPIRWVGAWCAAMVAVASHLLLDLTNAYGIRLLAPFSEAWQRLDITNVVDFWIWGAVLLGVAGPFLSHLVGMEMSSGRRRPEYPPRGFAIFALSFLLLYDGGRAVLHARATAALDARVYRGEAPLRVAAIPGAANPLRWRGVVETADFYAVDYLNVAGEFDPARADLFYKPEPGAAIEAARRAPAVAEMLRFAQYPLWRVTPSGELENGHLVEVFDMRFGDPLEPGIMARALVDSENRVVKASFDWGVPQTR